MTSQVLIDLYPPQMSSLVKPLNKWKISNVSQVMSGQVRSGQVRSGQVRSGQVRSGQVRSGQVRSGQIRSVWCCSF
jgi:GTPase